MVLTFEYHPLKIWLCFGLKNNQCYQLLVDLKALVGRTAFFKKCSSFMISTGFMSSLKVRRFTEMGILQLDNGSNYETLKNDISFQTLFKISSVLPNKIFKCAARIIAHSIK